MTIKLVTDKKIAETSSKGNQEKWFDSEENIWYKLDLFGYEALAETVVSKLLKLSNIEENGIKITDYDMTKVMVHKIERTACVSKNFLKDGEEIITIAALLRKGIGSEYIRNIEKQSSLQKKIDYIVTNVEKLTGLDGFGEYLTLLFETDMLFLNDDRHLDNIAVIRKENKFDYCPLFDYGAGLLSNIRDYPLDIEAKGMIKNVVARPFDCNFVRQINAAEKLYGRQFEPEFTNDDVEKSLENVDEYYSERYASDFKDRIKVCIKTQRNKYR